MKRDTKFGWHSIWILPMFYVLLAVEAVRKKYYYLRIRWAEFRNPEIKRLKKLAGK
jgi:hypothetical protein